MLLVVALGLLKLLWVVGCAGHLKKYGADAVNGAQVVGVDAEHFLEFRDGLIAETSVGFGGSARDVLAGVRRSQVQASVHEGWVELLGLFEILDGLVVLAVLEGVDTLIEEVASLQLVASRHPSLLSARPEKAGLAPDYSRPPCEGQKTKCSEVASRWLGQ